MTTSATFVAIVTVRLLNRSAKKPPAIENTYRFCRALFARRLRRILLRERFKLRVVERALGQLPPLPTPRDLIAILQAMKAAGAIDADLEVL